MLFNYISLPIFLMSFAVGLFVAYVLGPEMKTIYVYPSPDNIDKVLFKDNAENCFAFQATEVKCPKNKKLLGIIPVQM